MSTKKNAYEKKASKRINDVFQDEYEAGRQSYQNGDHQDSNPFPSMCGQNGSRQAWFNGWLDAWRETKWGE